MSGGKNSANRIALRQRRYRAFELRLQGKSFREIAPIIEEEFNLESYHYTTCQKDVDEIMKTMKIESSKDLHYYRQMELARLDKYLDKLWHRVEIGDTDAINSAVRMTDTRAKLLGLYQPVEVRVNEIVEARLTGELTLFFEALTNEISIPDEYKAKIIELAANLTDSAEMAWNN